MHNTLEHALGQGTQGPGTQKGSWAGPRPWTAASLGPGPWVPWPRACTRMLCMHKRSLLYTQEILLCIHNKCILILSYHILRRPFLASSVLEIRMAPSINKSTKQQINNSTIQQIQQISRAARSADQQISRSAASISRSADQ